jgi:TRAP-type C4-dicarboxylate transport system permease small subunit
MMSVIEKVILKAADVFNWAAAVALVGMMFLTCADVIMRRSFNYPIPGTYEIVSLLGVLLISCGLACTTVQRGHIVVEFLVETLSKEVQRIIDVVTQCLTVMLFGIISWQSFLYAMDLMASGEVSMTVQIPIYPFVCGIAIGCLLVALVIILALYKSIKRWWIA